MESYIPHIVIIIKCLAAVLVGIFLGNGAVYIFNKMPATWFCDYGEAPTEDMTDPFTQRIKSCPWKFLFSMLFIAIGVYMVVDDYMFAIPAVLLIWLLVEMSIGDIKYGIIPDQLIILAAVAAVGFLPYHSGWKDCLFGALIGFGLMAFIGLIGKVAYGRYGMGGGDIKLFAALGLTLGVSGTIIVFVLTTLLSSAHFLWQLSIKRIKKGEERPLVPYIAMSTGIFLVFLWSRVDLLLQW